MELERWRRGWERRGGGLDRRPECGKGRDGFGRGQGHGGSPAPAGVGARAVAVARAGAGSTAGRLGRGTLVRAATAGGGGGGGGGRMGARVTRLGTAIMRQGLQLFFQLRNLAAQSLDVSGLRDLLGLGLGSRGRPGRRVARLEELSEKPFFLFALFVLSPRGRCGRVVVGMGSHDGRRRGRERRCCLQRCVGLGPRLWDCLERRGNGRQRRRRRCQNRAV